MLSEKEEIQTEINTRQILIETIETSFQNWIFTMLKKIQN